MLTAQSELEDMPLITVDPTFESFAIQVLW
jgi:PIN domain nuclease of toxin-antitoxin system